MVDEPLTITLRAAHAGDRSAADRAYSALYPALLRIARSRLRAHQPNTLLDTQGLVHETFMRFVEANKLGIEDRKHFFAYAAKTMRNVVIDFARKRQAERRGGGADHVTLDSELFGNVQPGKSIVDVDAALLELASREPVLAQVVEMRYFGGYTDSEIAEALEISVRTVARHWDKARAFMLLELQG